MQNRFGWDEDIRITGPVRTPNSDFKRKRRQASISGSAGSPPGSPLGYRPMANLPISKRPRTPHHQKDPSLSSHRPVSLRRRLETLSREELVQLITSLSGSYPEMAAVVARTVPNPSPEAAIEVLKSYASRITNRLPYKGDPAGEYAYLRVSSHIDDFFAALADYTVAFLPPNEPQPSTSLAFFDRATDLLHKLPEFATEENNLHRNAAYTHLASAWMSVLREAATKSPLYILSSGYEAKLARHNELSGGRMCDALDALRGLKEQIGPPQWTQAMPIALS